MFGPKSTSDMRFSGMATFLCPVPRFFLVPCVPPRVLLSRTPDRSHITPPFLPLRVLLRPKTKPLKPTNGKRDASGGRVGDADGADGADDDDNDDDHDDRP